MFDGFSIGIDDERAISAIEKCPAELYTVDPNTGELVFASICNGLLRVRVYNRREARIRGSINKYHTGGNNDGLFTYSGLKAALQKFCSSLSLNPNEAKISRIEFGVNMHVSDPSGLIDAAKLYKWNLASSEYRKDFPYKEWEFSSVRKSDKKKKEINYLVKLYYKKEGTVRFEIVKHNHLHISGACLRTLSDLIDEAQYISCLQYLHASAANFIFLPQLSTDNSWTPEERIQWLQWRDDVYWGTIDNSTRRRDKKQIQQFIKDRELIDWCQCMQKEIIDKGALMLGWPTSILENVIAGRISIEDALKQESSRAEDANDILASIKAQKLISILVTFFALGLEAEKLRGDVPVSQMAAGDVRVQTIFPTRIRAPPSIPLFNKYIIISIISSSH